MLIFYYLIVDEIDSSTGLSHYDNLQKVKSWGFKVSDAMQLCRTQQEVADYLAHRGDFAVKPNRDCCDRLLTFSTTPSVATGESLFALHPNVLSNLPLLVGYDTVA